MFSNHIKIKWITNYKTILAFIEIDENPEWMLEIIGLLEKSVTDFIGFLKLFGICSMTTFSSFDMSFEPKSLTKREIYAQNKIFKNLKFQENSNRFKEIILIKGNFRPPNIKSIDTSTEVILIFYAFRDHHRKCPNSLCFSENVRFDFYQSQKSEAFILVTIFLCHIKNPIEYGLLECDILQLLNSVFFRYAKRPVLKVEAFKSKAFNEIKNQPSANTNVKIHIGSFLSDGFGLTWRDVMHRNEMLDLDLDEMLANLHL